MDTTQNETPSSNDTSAASTNPPAQTQAQSPAQTNTIKPGASATTPAPASPSTPAPTSGTETKKDDPGKAEKGRADGVSTLNRLTDEFVRLEKVAEAVRTPEVDRWLKETISSLGDFQRAVGEAPVAKVPVQEEQVLWLNERKLLNTRVRTLQKALSLTPLGKQFVAETKNKHRPEQAARNMRDAMNPGVLGHNGPLFQQMLAALAQFDKVAGQYTSTKTKAVPILMALAFHTRKLELCFQGLRGTIKAVKAERALQTLKLGSPTRKRTKKKSSKPPREATS
jgi:hypothetical protein